MLLHDRWCSPNSGHLTYPTIIMVYKSNNKKYCPQTLLLRYHWSDQIKSIFFHLADKACRPLVL